MDWFILAAIIICSLLLGAAFGADIQKEVCKHANGCYCSDYIPESNVYRGES